MSDLRQTILSEIKRLTLANGGRAPGRRSFEQQTGIREAEWLGIYWARWGDAVTEAGFTPNQMQGRADRNQLFERLAESCHDLGRMPTAAEFQLRRAADPTFPSYKTYEVTSERRTTLSGSYGSGSPKAATSLDCWSDFHRAVRNCFPGHVSMPHPMMGMSTCFNQDSITKSVGVTTSKSE